MIEYIAKYTRHAIFIFHVLATIQLIWAIEEVIMNIFILEEWRSTSVSAAIEMAAVRVMSVVRVIFIRMSSGIIF